MESSSTIYVSPSFDRHSSNDIADIADRVVEELRAENGLHGDDLFSFSDEDTPANNDDDEKQVNTDTQTEIVKRLEEIDLDEDGPEFEFPVVCNSSPVEIVADEHISPRYPLFDTSLLSEIDLNSSNSTSEIEECDSRANPSPTTRPSLRKLFSEDRDSVSCSSSEADDLDGITPGTYCVWKPKTEAPQPRGKHKKSNSVSIDLNTSKRWKVRDLLKRSYSDDNYSTTTTAGKEAPVVLFLPPISPNRKTNNEKVKKIEKIGCSVGCGGGGVTSAKIEKQIPAYKAKIGNIRLPPYYPYRQDQVGMFAANFNGSSKNLYRY